MAIDLLKLIDQLKTFLDNESDTFFGLLFFLIAELLIVGYAGSLLILDLKPYLLSIYGVAMVLTVIAWAIHRHIPIPKTGFSIAVANLNIISLNIKDGVTGQDKLTLEDEILEYVEDALHGHKKRFNFDKYISIVRLPARIKITENNARRYAKKIKAGILIRGTVKYASQQEVYIEPHFDFRAEPQETFYNHFKERLHDVGTYKIDLTTELASSKDTAFSNLVHYLIYIALLFEGIQLMNKRWYSKANAVFGSAVTNISAVQNPNRTLLDLHLALKFYEGKNLHQWGNFLKKHKQREAAILKYDEAAKVFFEKSVDKDFLEHSYLYGVHMLIKEGKIDDAKQKLEQVETKLKQNPELIKEEIEMLSAKSKLKAKKFIQTVNPERIKGKEKIFQQVGDFYYKEKDFGKAEQFYKQKLTAQPHDLYEPALFDVDDHLKLMNIHLKHLELIKAEKEALTATVNRIKNRMVTRL